MQGWVIRNYCVQLLQLYCVQLLWEAKLNIAIIVSPLKNIVLNFTICGIRQFFLKSA